MAIIIIGNKSDLEDKREVEKDEGIKKSDEYKTAFMETSALNGDNVDKAFDELIDEIYQNNCSIIEQDKEIDIDKGVNLNEEKNENKEKKKKCCI